MFKPLSTVFILLTTAFTIKAQEEPKNSIEFSPQFSVGVFTAQHKLTGTAYGGELLYHINTENNPTAWMKAMHLKSIDVVFNYKNMSNIKIDGDARKGLFGDSYALLGGLNISLLKAGKTEFLFSPAFGLGYAGETFFTNQNPLIGGHINFTSRASLKVTTALSPATQLAAGIDVLHYSNAAFRVPNNGINSSSLSLGIIQYLNTPAKPSENISSAEESYKKHSVDIGVNIGRRGVYQSKDGYFRTGLYTGYNYRLNPILALSTGVDAVYYHSVFDPANFGQTYQSYATSYDHWRVGMALGPDIWMGKLALMVKYGYYLHYNSYRDNHTYWTAGMKYNLLDWAAVQAKIYVHKTEADFVGFGFMFTPRL
ncbi:acyloxyacyl hydrolase [Pedobacter frigoris]|uniref:Acyloxyacyl hydrolase n=1 Tax=Pedobacter frigoris TaxID=2571272 RepID=A0A4U1CBN7_9SPHI|nr:acyloxyacyl hydrolase [Pedobacter frigoris]TKC04139.1 acyloxyacyl hydrolase [Pedobacter frigoris]